jgi:probable lipoprotein NlpC
MNTTKQLAFAKYFLCFSLIFLLSSCGLFERLRNANDHKKETNSRASRVVEAAREKTGSPYKFGGKTASGYDCSGLVFVSFEEVGMRLPRTSSEQATVGKEIALENVRPGDLVFFATKKGDSKISHVGIVTEIKEKEVVLFIHAANTGVQEDNLYSKYYQKTFIIARRMF